MTHPCPCGGVCDCHASSQAFPRPCNLPGGCGSAAAARPDAPSRVRSGEPEPAAPPDLADVVASLVRPTSATVVVEGRDPGDGSLMLARRTVTVEPLLAELRAEVAPGGESGGSGRGGGVPLAVDVADVLRDLERLVAAQLAALGLRPRRHVGVRVSECVSCSTPAADCRAGLDATGHLVRGPHLPDGPRCCSRHRHPAPPDRVADALAQLVPAQWPAGLPAKLTRAGFTAALAELVERGRAVLDGETTGTYVRDHRCPVCQVEWVSEKGQGGWDRHPALRINRGKSDGDGRPGPVRGTTCTGCGRRWSWADMQGPTLHEPAGALWALLDADQWVVWAGRHRRQQADRQAEQAARAALYGDTAPPTAAALGLPRYTRERTDA